MNSDKANCNGNFPFGTKTKGRYLGSTTAIEAYPITPWGLADMQGNVYEWCCDRYGAHPRDAVVDPFGVDEKDAFIDGTTPVKKYAPNPQGLYDTSGNVWEWVLDACKAYPTGSVDPQGTESDYKDYGIIRGGSWNCHAGGCRSACRHASAPIKSQFDTWFRILLRCEFAETLNDVANLVDLNGSCSFEKLDSAEESSDLENDV